MTNPIPVQELPFSGSFHAFVGRDHGGVGLSFFLVNAEPGDGPALHRHPYAEVFIVQEGTATFMLDDGTVEVTAGHVVVARPGQPHGFSNSGNGKLRMIAIHGNDHFVTEWLTKLAGPNPWED